MRALLGAQLRPADFRRGRLAVSLCGLYLLLVVVASVYTVVDAVVEESIGVSFAGLPLVVLTAPLSLVISPVEGVLAAMLFPGGSGWAGTAVFVVESLAVSLVQAYLGWLVLRGPRRALAVTAPTV